MIVRIKQSLIKYMIDNLSGHLSGQVWVKGGNVGKNHLETAGDPNMSNFY